MARVKTVNWTSFCRYGHPTYWLPSTRPALGSDILCKRCNEWMPVVRLLKGNV